MEKLYDETDKATIFLLQNNWLIALNLMMELEIPSTKIELFCCFLLGPLCFVFCTVVT